MAENDIEVVEDFFLDGGVDHLSISLDGRQGLDLSPSEAAALVEFFTTMPVDFGANTTIEVGPHPIYGHQALLFTGKQGVVAFTLVQSQLTCLLVKTWLLARRAALAAVNA